jgi:DNA-binding beta-propeller fold protein YncE
VELDRGTISTYAGTGERGPITDGAPLAGTPFNGPRALTTDREGNLYVALREGNAVYRIDAGMDPRVQRVHHIAGTGEQGYSGDGGPARQAKLSGPKGIAYAPDGSLYIADTESHTIRRIDLKTDIIQTVAGTGQRGDGPDGDPLGCHLSRPHGIFVASDGAVYIGDSESHRIRVLR